MIDVRNLSLNLALHRVGAKKISDIPMRLLRYCCAVYWTTESRRDQTVTAGTLPIKDMSSCSVLLDCQFLDCRMKIGEEVN
jgi:hypothetical protein